jgi:hypothetical protein
LTDVAQGTILAAGCLCHTLHVFLLIPKSSHSNFSNRTENDVKSKGFIGGMIVL